MLTRRTTFWLATLSLAFWLGTAAPSQADGLRSPSRLTTGYGRYPLVFEANQGQVPPAVAFLTRGAGYSLSILNDGIGIALGGENGNSALRLRWLGSRPEGRLSGEGRLAGVHHVLVGSDPSRWRTHLPLYTRVRHAELYPGIDLVYYGNPRQLEYDLIVAPGADPAAARFAVEGAERVEVDAAGDLVLSLAGRKVRLLRPVTWQEEGGKRRAVASAYRMLGGGHVGFSVAEFDRTRSLVIDPVLAYSTFLGGEGNDASYGLAADRAGFAYVTGETSSPDFPLANPLQAHYGGNYDAFVTKLSPAGELVWSTFLGGSEGEGGWGAAVDRKGNVYVGGYTASSDFPLVHPIPMAASGGSEAFVTKLSPDGASLLFSTTVGGSSFESVTDLAIDPRGSVYVTGHTGSPDFPGEPVTDAQRPRSFDTDVFVTKLAPDGRSLVYSVLLGGSGQEGGGRLAVDAAGRAWVSGFTNSTEDFPLLNPLVPEFQGPWYSGFLARLERGGSAVLSTYFAGASSMAGYPSGEVWVSGAPTHAEAGPGINLTRIDQQGRVEEIWRVAAPSASIRDLAVGNRRGEVWVAGATTSPVFPLVDPVDDECAPLFAPGECVGDGFVVKLVNGSLVFSTYLGGDTGMTSYPGDDAVSALALDGYGNVIASGWTYSVDFPAVNAAQPQHGGGEQGLEIDAFAAKIEIGRRGGKR